MLLARDPVSQSFIPPPPGVTQNLNANVANTAFYKYNIAIQVLAFFSVGSCVFARAYVKLFVKKELKAEDYACFVAFPFMIAQSVMCLLTKQFHFGLHAWDVPANDVVPYLRFLQYGGLAYLLAAFFTKTSILCLIAGTFAPRRRVVMFTRIMIGLMALYYIPICFIRVFRCNPVRKAWHAEIPGKCFATADAIFIADCVISIITDWTILILPMPLVWMLHTTFKQKLRIMTVFAGGIFACLANIGRIVQTFTLSTMDVTYSIPRIALWAVAEVSIGLICSCLPILTILYRQKGWTNSSGSSKTSYLRLRALTGNTSAASDSGVERAKLSSDDASQPEAAVGFPAYKADLGANSEGQGLSTSVNGRNDLKDESYSGDGILKTVNVEQTGLPVP